MNNNCLYRPRGGRPARARGAHQSKKRQQDSVWQVHPGHVHILKSQRHTVFPTYKVPILSNVEKTATESTSGTGTNSQKTKI